nr:MAG TPA: hypothetical protein [Caudoviricetes sp.]DAK04391.1 MAG TPA: hypothetical protein [Caudoviricetes sp.]
MFYKHTKFTLNYFLNVRKLLSKGGDRIEY